MNIVQHRATRCMVYFALHQRFTLLSVCSQHYGPHPFVRKFPHSRALLQSRANLLWCTQSFSLPRHNELFVSAGHVLACFHTFRCTNQTLLSCLSEKCQIGQPSEQTKKPKDLEPEVRKSTQLENSSVLLLHNRIQGTRCR